MDFIARKVAYIYLKISEWTINLIVLIYAILYKRKNKNALKKSIGAYWYYPPDLTGSNLRLGGWKQYFEKDGYSFTNLHLNKLQEFVNNVEKGSWTKRYFFFAKNLWRRLPQILQAHKFDTIWIDRALIPFYPRKSAFLEKQIQKVVVKMVVDVTDGGDYQDNPQLYGKIYSYSNELTVGYKFLTEYFGNDFKLTQVFWTIPTDNYTIKEDYSFDKVAVIGWMGSPANFEHVRNIIPQLKELSTKHDFIFRYICRQNFDNEFEGIKTEHHFFGEDYYKLIGSFDIGISPFLTENLRTKGKIAMKHQEFLLMGIPQICSPVAISEFVKDKKDVIIASNNNWTELMESLILNHDLRESLGKNSRALFNKYYTYPSQYEKLKKVLVTVKQKK
jgi:glycosyltransferase involved in cell wall biosynthesis